MSLLEGFSDWVMDEVGTELLPDVPVIRERFEARRNQRRGTLDRLIARLTGLDLKIEQYRRGEKFVAGVASGRWSRGREAHLGRARRPSPATPRWPIPRRGCGGSLPQLVAATA